MAGQTKLLTNNNYSPENISNLVNKIKAFIQVDGHFYDILDFIATKPGAEDKLRSEASKWNSSHSTNTNFNAMFDMLKFLRDRANVWVIPLLTTLKGYCAISGNKEQMLCNLLKLLGGL